MVTMAHPRHHREHDEPRTAPLHVGRSVGVVWFLYVSGSLALLDVVDLTWWGVVVPAAGAVLSAVPAWRPSSRWSPRLGDLAAIGLLYVAIVGFFRLAFEGFTTDRVAGLFLSFAAGLLLGVIGPLVYQVWWRRGTLADLGLSADRLGSPLDLVRRLQAVPAPTRR
jgi:hypothetical protein